MLALFGMVSDIAATGALPAHSANIGYKRAAPHSRYGALGPPFVVPIPGGARVLHRGKPGAFFVVVVFF